eukprot:scaffold834_cov130-Isochrysis_galbana.AAC.3
MASARLAGAVMASDAGADHRTGGGYAPTIRKPQSAPRVTMPRIVLGRWAMDACITTGAFTLPHKGRARFQSHRALRFSQPAYLYVSLAAASPIDATRQHPPSIRSIPKTIILPASQPHLLICRSCSRGSPPPFDQTHAPAGRFAHRFDLHFVRSRAALQRYLKRGEVLQHPPGNEIYRSAAVSVFEVDAARAPTYCQARPPLPRPARTPFTRCMGQLRGSYVGLGDRSGPR